MVVGAGGAVRERTTDAFVKVIGIDAGGRSGYAAQTAVSAGRLDPAALAERAARKATASGRPAALEPASTAW